jgi:hypothetical protein
MIGLQARPCMNLFVMYRLFGVVPQSLDVLFPSFFMVIFGALSWRFSWSDFGTFLLGIWCGMYA